MAEKTAQVRPQILQCRFDLLDDGGGAIFIEFPFLTGLQVSYVKSFSLNCLLTESTYIFLNGCTTKM